MSTNSSPSPRRPLHHHALAIMAAPLAHVHHRRYHGRPFHLAVDTVINLGIWGLLVTVIVLILTRTGANIPQLSWSPTEMTSGQTTELKVRVAAPSDTDLQNVTLDLRLPNGWTTTAETVTAVGSLAAGQITERSYTILPLGEPDEHVSIQMIVRWQANDRVLATTGAQVIRLVGSAFDLTVTAPAEVAAGQTWPLNVEVRSTSPLAANQVAVRLSVPNSVTVLSSEPALKDLAWTVMKTGEALERFQVQLRSSVTQATTVRLSVRVEIQSGDQRWTQITRSTDVRIEPTKAEDVVSQPSAQPSFAAEVRYRSATGQQFGYGPFPPTVGQETVYRVFWYVRPGQRAATSGVVTMSLPAGIRWAGHQSISGGSQLTYDGISRRVRWTIGTLSGGGQPMVGSFDIGLTPTAASRGLSLRLTNQALFSLSSGPLVAPALTTRDVDGGAGRNGLVQ